MPSSVKTSNTPLWAKFSGYLALSSIFGTSLVVLENPIPINISFILAILSILWITFLKRGNISKALLFTSLFILLHSLLGLYLDTTSVALMSKVFISSVLFYVAFGMIINIFRHKIDILINLYITCCLLVSIIGLFQFFSFFVHFRPGYDFTWFLNRWVFVPTGPLGIRLNSILAEPSQVAFTMGPAIALSFYRILYIKPYLISWFTASTILLFAILSLSSSVHIVLGVAIILMVKVSIKKAMMFATLGLIFFVAIINSIYLEASLLKLKGLIDLFNEGLNAKSADATTYTLYVHFKVAWENFLSNWGLGGGLGSHEYLFSKYQSKYESVHNIYSISTAGNITFRLISELGMIGLTILGGYFFIAISGILCLLPKQRLLHAALVAGIAAYLVRNGTYAHFGLAFYVTLLMVNYKDGCWLAKYSKVGQN